MPADSALQKDCLDCDAVKHQSLRVRGFGIAAGVIEAVAWTGGSTHTHMLRHGQSWVARHNLDLYVIIVCVAVAAVLLPVYFATKAFRAIRALRNQPKSFKSSKQA